MNWIDYPRPHKLDVQTSCSNTTDIFSTAVLYFVIYSKKYALYLEKF